MSSMRRVVKVEVDGTSLDARIIGVERGRPEDSGYSAIILRTDRGELHCRYYGVKWATRGVAMVGGIGGDFDSPAKGLYPKLAGDLLRHGIGSIRVEYRHPADLAESTLDTIIGISFMRGEGIGRTAVIGHSLGGAVAAQAAANDPTVKTLVTLSAQSFGISPLSRLKDVSTLLIHGEADSILPPACSSRAYDEAAGPKELLIYQGAGHVLDEAAEEVYCAVKDWILTKLR